MNSLFPIFGLIKLTDLPQATKATLIHSAVIVPYSKIPDKMHPNSPHFQPLQKNCIAVNGTEIVQYSKSATARFKTKIVVGQDLCNPNLYHMDFFEIPRYFSFNVLRLYLLILISSIWDSK